MLRSVASKVMWVGRTTVFLIGLAVILSLTVGVVSKATAHTGYAGLFHLGHPNAASALSSLVGTVSNGMLQVTNNSTATTATSVRVTNKSRVSPAVRATNSGGGPALGLKVASGKAPMTVNSGAKVANLNADKLDGLDSTEIGVNGVETVYTESASNSDSYKVATATCPEGKIAVGSGYVLIGGKRGTFPNMQTDVVITYIIAEFDHVQVAAYEEEPTSDNWSVKALARCAKEGT